ncbi:MAG TPA: ATP-binding protein [Bradyrhizobium sp.]|uniref:hybrid sensor histidine kinase/response regulator n=1 Tax=Bradyrhizobium sp. TaxID=376 RepID=UPI002CD97864|nr:ATP-binding protein [Bradyrhizobium sp.]HLZ05906.1 ATP-binding protein [Bradyrhizobium sp.]
MKARRDRALWSLRLILIACATLPALLFAYASWASYKSAFAAADENITRSLDIAVGHAQAVFQSTFVTIDSVEQITRGRSAENMRAQESELNQRLREMRAAIPDIESIWLFNSAGRPIASSLLIPVPSDLDVSGTKFFTSQRDPHAPVFIGPVFSPQATARNIFPVSKRRIDETGNFKGVIEVSIQPSAFESFFAGIARGTTASLTLICKDGSILARYPLPATVGIKLDPTSGFATTIARSPQGGRFTVVSAIDHIERRFALRKLPGFPVYVAASLATNDIRRGWLLTMASQLVYGLPATVLLIALVLLAERRTKAFYAEAESRQAVEANLRQSQKMDAVGQLTGGIAHDFNNLLTIIIGNLQMALKHEHDAKIQRTLSNALAGAERAAALTKRLLSFSRRQPLDPSIVDADRLIAGLSDLLNRTLGEKVSIETVASAGLWQTEVDTAELESAIVNLAINARDAMLDGGKLTIETGNAFLDEDYCRLFEDLKPGQYVMISVTDTGCGMPSEIADKATEPFFTTKPAGEGTGLGLSQVYGFVKQSGGHLRIYSELGEGTTVRMYLPRCLSSAPELAPTSQGERLQQGSGETILVVEDDPDVRAYVVEALSGVGYRVVEAGDAEAALTAFASNSEIHLMLTDVVMPGMNGRALADMVRQSHPAVKTLFMTGYSRNAIVHQGRLDPGVSLIQKPFSQASLAARIRSLLDAQLAP